MLQQLRPLNGISFFRAYLASALLLGTLKSYVIAVISMTCFMALDLSTIQMSEGSSFIQAKQV